MSLVSLRDVTIGFGGHPLLEGVSMQIEARERVALVGRNGVGKSTLIGLVGGDLRPDSGSIERVAGIRVARLPQSVPAGICGTCREVVAAGARLADDPGRKRMESIISRLCIASDRSFDDLSGGQKRRVLLGRALAGEPDLLLLDEPTNHLDIDSIEWLEGFLSRFAGAVLFVTHDRMFLGRLATRIVDLTRGRLSSWPGDYALYLSGKAHTLDVEARQNARFDKLLAQEEAWIREGVRARRTRNEGRVRALEAMREAAARRRAEDGTARMRLQTGERTGKLAIRARGLGFGYGDAPPIVDDLSLSIARGDKVGIIGPNGVGKTTLIKLLLGELAPRSGTVERGAGLQAAYLDQLREQIDDERTVAENVADGKDTVAVPGGGRKHIVGYLKDFLFTADRARSPAGLLSGGERNRLLLARLFTRPFNLLVLDEPTNDLDLETLELLEELLFDYPGTALVVSHDRAFLNAVVTRTLVFEGHGRVGCYPGGYDDWLRQQGDAPGVAVKRAPKPAPAPRSKASARRRLSFKEKLALEELPKTIEALEREQAALQTELADPALYRDRGNQVSARTMRLAGLEAELGEAYVRWEELEAIREEGG
jgi:ATP-binding cassette subfamily F protein uup